MLFSVNYKSKFKQEADEIRCPYHQLGLIFQFIKDNPKKRYNILALGTLTSNDLSKAIEQIEYVREITSNYTIECDNIGILRSFLDLNYNAFLSFPTTDWETFQELKELGVSDIYIDGPLGFQIDKLKLGKENLILRASPYISTNLAISEDTHAPNFFFVRPEDLSLYEDTIDTVFFRTDDIEKADTLFTIYKRGSFFHSINALIPQLEDTVPNTYIKPDFAQHRLNCGQKCKIPGYSCHTCETEFHLTNMVIKYFESKKQLEDNKN